MLRVVSSASSQEAKSYYTDGLSRQDYYAEQQEIAGAWGGRGADRLGLAGTVNQAAFAALAENRHPWTGEPLTPRTKANRVVGYDFNFHCPKSVSVLHALTGDERIVEAFRAAVSATMQELERKAQTRVRKGGANSERTTGNLVWAEFVHFTARPVEGVPDPHLHAHCYVFNATFDPVEKQWKAGHFRDMVRSSPYFEAAFHARFALALERLGYQTERRGKFFELAGVPRELVEKFSQRTATITELAKELGIEDNADAKSKLGALTRMRKLKDLSTKQLKVAWRDSLEPGEWQTLLNLHRDAKRERPAHPLSPRPDDIVGGRAGWTWEEAAIRHAAAHGFERQSVLDEDRFIEIALRYGVGRVDVDRLWRTAQNRPDLLRRVKDGRTKITTPTVLKEEQTMVLWVKNGQGQAKPMVPGHLILDPKFNEEQRKAVRHVLTSTDRVTGIEGRAGTGKTTVMKEALNAIRSRGHSVLVLTPTAKMAQEVLPKDGILGAATVAKLLQDGNLQQEQRGGVWWVDEAGMLSSPMMAKLCEAAERHGARLVLSGDTRQHGSVERGEALRILKQEAGLRLALVETIQRQKGAYRAAVHDCSQGRVKDAIEKFDGIGAIREITTKERYKALAKEYLDARTVGASAVIISPSHSEGRRVTDVIRDDLKASGQIQRERLVPRLRSLDMTAAQRADADEYKKGYVVEFTQWVKGFKAGERLTVVEMAPKKKHTVVVERPDGIRKELDIAEYADRFQVYERSELPVCQGELICVTKNSRTWDRRYKVSNGSLRRVVGFTEDGQIKLEGGKVLAADFCHLNHGYVVTSMAAQGMTVDRVFLAQSAESFGAANMKQFYTSVARGRHLIRIYTDNREQLLEGATRLCERTSAMELMREWEEATQPKALKAELGERSEVPALSLDDRAEPEVPGQSSPASEERETTRLRFELGEHHIVPEVLERVPPERRLDRVPDDPEPEPPTMEMEMLP